MGQYSKSYNSSFTSDGFAKVFNLAYLPRSVFMLNKTQTNDQTSDNPGEIKRAWGYSSDANGVAYYVKNTDAALTDQSGAISSGGFSFITRDTPMFGPTKAVTAITKAASAQLTVASHGYVVGHTVLLTATDNMDNIGGLMFYVNGVVDTNNFTIAMNTNTANFTVAAAGSVKLVLYPDLYIPFSCVVTAMTAATAAVVSTNVAHQFKVGQQVRLEGFANFGMVEAEAKTAFVTAIGTTSVTLDLDSSAYTAFAWPAPATIIQGSDFPMILPIGDKNFGFVGPTVPTPIGIPGAFACNTGYQVIVGIGDGTTDMHNSGDICEVQFEFPDQLGTSVAYAP